MKQTILSLLIFSSIISAYFNDSAELSKLGSIFFIGGIKCEDNLGFGIFAKAGYSPFYRYNIMLNLGYTADTESNYTPYFGIENKILIAEFFGGSDNLSTILGFHLQQQKFDTKREFRFGIDTSILVSNKIPFFQFIAGIYADLDFYTPNIKLPANFIMGAKLDFIELLDFVIEIGIPLSNDAKYGIMLSVNYSIKK